MPGRNSVAWAIVCVSAMLFLCAGFLHADVLLFGSRFSTDSITSASQAVSTWNTLSASVPTTGYCDVTPTSLSGLSNGLTMCAPGGSGGDIFAHTSISFSVASDTNILADIVADYGRGSVLLLDGTQVALNANDAFGSLFGPVSINLSTGNHVLDLYGSEHCCDGSWGGFSVSFDGGQTYGAVSDTTFANPVPANPVPEPASMVLLGSGAAAVFLRRRKK